MKTIKLIFGTHNSQPVGNFNHVIENVYNRSYKPFLSIINKYPDFKVTLHYSGVLFEWLEENHPEFMMLLQEMVMRKQVELIGGGYYEPILTMISSSDKLGQVEHLTTYIRSHFGKRPRGCWVTERVWQSGCASILHSSGMEYIFLDDIHFKSAGINDGNLFYPYLTEDQGKILSVFSLSKSLRYIIPYKEPEDVIKYLANLVNEEGDHVVTIIDDGEKYGEWKGSYKLCYENCWLSKFIELIQENSDWIETIHPGKYLNTYPPKAKIYFPSMLYEEMMDWVLSPSNEKNKNSSRMRMAIKSGEEGILPGGVFKGFFCKYPESNLMYSKMNHVSILVNQIKGDKYKKRAAKEELWKGQSNHAYWHGKFGGIYFNHLRKEVYRSLIEAEKLTRDKGIFMSSIICSDFDLDGQDEYLYQGNYINAYIHSKGGMMFELDYLPMCWNYLDTLSRYVEYYHGYMERENGYDSYLRKSFIDHFFDERTNIHEFSKVKYVELGNFIDNKYKLIQINRAQLELELESDGRINLNGKLQPLKINKKYVFRKNYIDVHYKLNNTGEHTLDFNFGIENNLALASNKKEDCKLLLIQAGRNIEVENGPHDVKDIEGVLVYDLRNNVEITLYSEKKFTLWSFPIDTISQTIDAFDRIYQSTCFMTIWNIKLNPGESWETVQHIYLRKKIN